MNLFNSILSWFIRQRIGQIQQFIDQPIETQQEVFSRLIYAARDTEWGKKHDYRSIDSVDAFKNRVPVQNYDTLKPYIERLMNGEQYLLWPSVINWFAKSSGTTSDKSKFIPVSRETLDECHYKGGKDLMSIYCNNNPDTLIFAGKGLVMGGSHQVSQLNDNSYYGDVSAVMLQNMPLIGQLIKTPDMATALMEDWEQKIEQIAQQTIKENVTHIAGVPTWTLVLIKHIFEITGKTNLLEVWPNLELYIHGGVSFTPYREQFRQLIPDKKMHYLETYNASEGFFGIQDSNDRDEMLLMLDYGIFYEFMPIEEADRDDPKTLQLDEVETGKNYAPVISTNSGLWRYVIGDTIQFTNLHPFRIQVTGRLKHFINAFGEEVIVENTDKALAEACQKTGAIVKDYTVAPIYISGEDKGGHEWLIEFEQSPDDLEYFTYLLDDSLKALNSDYEAKRYKDLALETPVIHPMKAGTFYAWLKSKGKLGGQHKVPRLSNDRKYVEDILGFVKG